MLKKQNIKKLRNFSFFTMFFISIPVLVPYSLSLGLTMQEILEIQSFFAFMVAVLEIPSGYFCDLYGRRKTLLIGAFFYGVGFTLLSFVTTYKGMLLYEFFTAIAFSFISGADIAFLYDQLDSSDSREDKSHAIAQMQFSQSVAEAIGSILGGFLASISLKLPFLAQSVVSWCPLLIALTFIETKEVKAKSHVENFGKVFKELMTNKTRWTLLNLVIWGLSSFCSVWILQKYWQDQKVPIAYFGIFWAFFNFTAGFTSKNIKYLKRYISRENLLLMAGLFPIIAYFSLGFFSGILVISFTIFFYLGRGMLQVLMREEFNHYIEDDMRATANSVQSFLFRIIFSVVGPLIGYSIDKKGTNTTFCYIGIVFLVLYFVTLVPYVKKLKNELKELS